MIIKFKKKLENRIQAQEIYSSISDYLPKKDSHPHSLNSYLETILSRATSSFYVLDLGCGEGNSIEVFEKLNRKAVWHGVDIEDSPEVKKRTIMSDSITTFNGVNLPYEDNFFDLVYTNQVLEHVRHPDALIADVFRVMKCGGIFIGSVSYLEPYHSYSIFNYTPYGISEVINSGGLKLIEIRPETDALMLIIRQLLNRSKYLRFIWKHNYLYTLISIIGILFNLGHRELNFLKVQFSGHLVFLALKPMVDKSLK